MNKSQDEIFIGSGLEANIYDVVINDMQTIKKIWIQISKENIVCPLHV